MNSTVSVANQELLADPTPLMHHEAVARLGRTVGAMAALDRQIERCTDPVEESCLLTLREEQEIEYLETLFRWEYAESELPALQPA
jgi:hypothetical protein